MSFNEFIVEDATLTWFEDMGYAVWLRLHISPREPAVAIVIMDAST
jgi:hypothetical protein